MKKKMFLGVLVSAMLLLTSCTQSNASNGSIDDALLLYSVIGSTTLLVILSIFSAILPCIISGIMADKENRSVGLWIFISILIGWIAVLILAIKMQHEQNNIVLNLKEAEYEKHKCSKCGEIINTKRCGYCGFTEEGNNLIKKDRWSVISKTKEKWTCKCGSVNGHLDYECPKCFSPRPKD